MANSCYHNEPQGYTSNHPRVTSSWPSLAWNDVKNYDLHEMNCGNMEDANTGFYSTDEHASESLEMASDLYDSNLRNRTTSAFYSTLLCLLQFWYCFTANEEYKQEMKRRRTKSQGNTAANSVSRIDTVSRILFPCVFLLLNVSYWSLYINERNADFVQWE